MTGLRITLLALFCASVPGVARAGGWWAPQHERRAIMARLAQKSFGGDPRYYLATPHTVRAFNSRFGTTLPEENVGNVAIIDWAQFHAFARETRSNLLGVGYFDHGPGPHAHLVVGDRIKDSIQEDYPKPDRWPGKMRDRDLAWLGKDGLVFGIWYAPTEDLTAVGQRSAHWVNQNWDRGQHCVHFVHDSLRVGSSHFADLAGSGRWKEDLLWPWDGAPEVLHRDPDIVLQVADGYFRDAMLSNPEHRIKAWSNQE